MMHQKDIKVTMMIWDNASQQTATQNYCKALEENIDGLSVVYVRLDAQNEGANIVINNGYKHAGCVSFPIDIIEPMKVMTD